MNEMEPDVNDTYACVMPVKSKIKAMEIRVRVGLVLHWVGMKFIFVIESNKMMHSANKYPFA